MVTLTVRKLDEKLVKSLKAKAGSHGISSEEEHRRILKKALSEDVGKVSLKDFLKSIPNWGEEEIFQRTHQTERKPQF